MPGSVRYEKKFRLMVDTPSHLIPSAPARRLSFIPVVAHRPILRLQTSQSDSVKASQGIRHSQWQSSVPIRACYGPLAIKRHVRAVRVGKSTREERGVRLPDRVYKGPVDLPFPTRESSLLPIPIINSPSSAQPLPTCLPPTQTRQSR
jgi:hypothetical protein